MSNHCDWEQEAVEHLVAMRAQLDVMNARALELIGRLDGIIAQVGAVSICADGIEHRLDRIDYHLDRVEAKLH